jgi:hypothetical protein
LLENSECSTPAIARHRIGGIRRQGRRRPYFHASAAPVQDFRTAGTNPSSFCGSARTIARLLAIARDHLSKSETVTGVRAAMARGRCDQSVAVIAIPSDEDGHEFMPRAGRF